MPAFFDQIFVFQRVQTRSLRELIRKCSVLVEARVHLDPLVEFRVQPPYRPLVDLLPQAPVRPPAELGDRCVQERVESVARFVRLVGDWHLEVARTSPVL